MKGHDQILRGRNTPFNRSARRSVAAISFSFSCARFRARKELIEFLSQSYFLGGVWRSRSSWVARLACTVRWCWRHSEMLLLVVLLDKPDGHAAQLPLHTSVLKQLAPPPARHFLRVPFFFSRRGLPATEGGPSTPCPFQDIQKNGNLRKRRTFSKAHGNWQTTLLS